MSPRALPVALLFVILACPPPARAQAKDDFLRALVDFTNAANGIYGDEGPALLAALEAMQAGLAQWDAAVAKVESGFASSIGGATPPMAARMRAALASVYLDRHRVEDAIPHLDAAVQLDPEFGEAHALRGLLLQAAGREDEASIAFRAAWRHSNGDPANAYLFLTSTAMADVDALTALSAAALGDPVRGGFAIPAVGLFDETSLQGPVFVGAHYAPAAHLLVLGEYAKALAQLRELTASDSLVADAALKSDAAVRLSAALRSNDAPGAIASGQTLVAQYPRSSEAHRLLGIAFWSASRYAESLTALRTAVGLNPRDERSWLSIADVLVESRDAAAALGALQETGRALPDSGRARWKLASLQHAFGDEGAALQSLHEAVRTCIGGVSHLLAAVGRLHHRQVDLESAEGAYRLRAQQAPNDSAAHFDLGEVLRAQEELDAALAEYLAAALLNPASARAMAMAGIVQASAGRDEDAVRLLRKAVTSEPGQLEARYALARALLRLGRAEEGRRELAVFQELQAQAMEEERRRYRENQQKIDAVLGQPPTETPR